ncbi:MAG: response regulator [Campylobacterota bacterium]|nr:response regulator [Campylobacterota bacterium]
MNSIKVLYVEDDKSIIEFVKVIFKKYDNFKVSYAYNGLEALEIYKNEKFDLVITDMMMPGMDGFELIENIKKISSKQMFIMVTALEDKDDLIKAIELRVNYFIQKPINPKKFNRILNEVIEVVNQRKEDKLSKIILEQYKYAIDTSTIMSKSDSNGKITFVNDEFCRLSKYRPEELIGKQHNILRDKSMPKDVFKDMWETIKSKKIWKGVIKNRAKDGTQYIVNAIIIPILDNNNNIMEYIGLRYDITQLELLKHDLQTQLDLAVKEIEDTQKEVVFTMGAIGETRSKETGNHVKRVAEYSFLLARLYGLNEEDSELLKLASPMHDIGKVGIPDSILNKPGRHTFDEFEIMKTHAVLGYDMLKGSKKDILKISAIVAYEHHEKWDGSGYPRGLKGEDIHIYGRITSVCDVFDALGSDRCYKKAWELEKILELFRDGRGSQFDPNLVDLFLNNLDKFLVIRDKYIDT